VIDRRTFLGTAALALLAAPRLGETHAVVSRHVPRVGVLGEVNPIPWMVKTSVVDIECRWAEGRRHRLPALAAELVALDADVLVAIGAASARAASQATASVPIVVVAGSDVGEDGLVGGMARSAANVTGLSVPSEAGMAQQRLTLLAGVVPGLRRVAVLWNPESATSALAFERLSRALSPPTEIRSFPARTVEDVEHAFAAMAADVVGGLLVLPDTLFAIHAARLVELAAEARLPVVYGARGFVESGGLMALHGDTGEIIRRTAAIVRQILAGTAPATLSLPTRLRPEVTLNVATARRLGLAVPLALLARADAIVTG
jgi:putative ABC transport system substrate-binding protein